VIRQIYPRANALSSYLSITNLKSPIGTKVVPVLAETGVAAIAGAYGFIPKRTRAPRVAASARP
jgi:hypothetical protein